MKPEEIAAYIGAAAWLPQIIGWLYARFAVPTLTIVTEKFAEVGYTSLGPIFNIRLMLIANRKSLIIDNCEIELTHADGDTHTFAWSGLLDTFSEIKDGAGNKQVVSKDQSPIAIWIGSESLVEKLIRFQEQKFHDTDRRNRQELVAHFNFLQESVSENIPEAMLKSKEYFNTVDFQKKWFWWKPGKYTIRFKLSSNTLFKLNTDDLYFEYSLSDVNNLNKNLSTIEAEIKNIIHMETEGYEDIPVNWNWTTVNIRKKSL